MFAWPGADPASSTYELAPATLPQASDTVVPLTRPVSPPAAGGGAEQPDPTISVASLAGALVPVSKFARSRRPVAEPASTTYDVGRSPPAGAIQESVTRAAADDTLPLRFDGLAGAVSGDDRGANRTVFARCDAQSADRHSAPAAMHCHATVIGALGAATTNDGVLDASSVDGFAGERVLSQL